MTQAPFHAGFCVLHANIQRENLRSPPGRSAAGEIVLVVEAEGIAWLARGGDSAHDMRHDSVRKRIPFQCLMCLERTKPIMH